MHTCQQIRWHMYILRKPKYKICINSINKYSFIYTPFLPELKHVLCHSDGFFSQFGSKEQIGDGNIHGFFFKYCTAWNLGSCLLIVVYDSFMFFYLRLTVQGLSCDASYTWGGDQFCTIVEAKQEVHRSPTKLKRQPFWNNILCIVSTWRAHAGIQHVHGLVASKEATWGHHMARMVETWYDCFAGEPCACIVCKLWKNIEIKP